MRRTATWLLGLSMIADATEADQSEVLSALPQFSVSCGVGDLKNKGLTEHQVQTDVELRLRQAGIRVVDDSDDVTRYLPRRYREMTRTC